jgi:imidazolonepropionase-like amidohydrolase
VTARSLLALAAATLLCAPALAQEKPAQARPEAGESVLAIVGGDVHTGTGTLIRRATVLCRGARIEAVGTDLKVPEGARVVDARGRWVLPGLVAPRGDKCGVQRGRPGRNEKFADCLDPESLYVELALSAGITAFHASTPYRARIRSADRGWRNVIYGSQNAILKPAKGRPELMVLKEPAALVLDWARSSPADRAEFEDLLRQGRKWIDGGKRSRTPVSSSIIAALERKLPVRITARTRSEITSALRLVKRHDLQAVLVYADEAWTVPERIAAAGAIPIVQPRGRRWPRPGEEETSGSRIENAAVLEKAGVPFCLLPPGGFGARPYGISLNGVAGRDLLTYALEGGFAIRGGASTDAALRAITLTAAEALGVADRVGSLAPGKDADIAVFQGDPFDFRTHVEVTIVSGRVLYERSKSKLLSHLGERKRE